MYPRRKITRRILGPVVQAVRLLSPATLIIMIIIISCGPKPREPVEGERVLRHVVERGETLEGIADDYYGDPDREDEIREFNMLDSDDVEPGDVLRIYMTPDDMEVLALRKRARAPYNAAIELVARGSYLDAVNRFNEAIDLDPEFSEAIYNLGVTFQKMNAHDNAVDRFSAAIRLRPENAEYRFALGNSYYHQKRYDDAASAFERALRIDDRHRKAQYALASCLEKTGKTVQARKAWLRYLELDADSEWADRARERLEALE
jgi:tetratricopeptide (TPR) repeat protein